MCKGSVWIESIKDCDEQFENATKFWKDKWKWYLVTNSYPKSWIKQLQSKKAKNISYINTRWKYLSYYLLAAPIEKYNNKKKTFLKFKKSLVKDPKTVKVYKQPLTDSDDSLWQLNSGERKEKKKTVITPFIDFNRRFYKAYLSKTFNNPFWFFPLCSWCSVSNGFENAERGH